METEEESREQFLELLRNDRPCFTCFGLKKACEQAIVRNKLETYSTGFRSTVNFLGTRDNLIPVEFAEHHLDEKLFTGRKGAILARLNRFSGWTATFDIQYQTNVYQEDAIVNIIELAGFGGGIGSGRSSDYGRFHVTAIAH